MPRIQALGRTCGAVLLLQMPAGCLPKDAKPLTEEQTEKLLNVFDDDAEHLPLLVDVASRGRALFVDNGKDAYEIALLSEWNTGLDRGYSMVDDGGFYTVPGDDLSGVDQDSAASVEAEGMALGNIRDTHEKIVFVEKIFDDDSVAANLHSAAMHELAHLVHNQFHDKEIRDEVVERNLNLPPVDDIVEHEDFAWRDSVYFDILVEMMTLGGPTISILTNVDLDIGDDAYRQAYFDDLYKRYKEYKNLVARHPEEWASFYAEYEYGSAREGNPLLLMDYFKTERTSFLATRLQEIDIDEKIFSEILLLDSASFIRENAVEYADEKMKEMQERFPELYQEYLREQQAEIRSERSIIHFK